MPVLFSSLAVELQPLSERLSAYVSGLPLLPTLDATTYAETISLSHVDNCLRVLDSCLLGRWQEDYEELSRQDADALRTERGRDLPKLLVALCIASDVLCREDDYISYRAEGE